MKNRRNKVFLSLSEWTQKELDDSIKYYTAFIEKQSLQGRVNEAFKDYVAKLTVERTSRIGKSK